MRLAFFGLVLLQAGHSSAETSLLLSEFFRNERFSAASLCD
jgi:hypothetical protein